MVSKMNKKYITTKVGKRIRDIKKEKKFGNIFMLGASSSKQKMSLVSLFLHYTQIFNKD